MSEYSVGDFSDPIRHMSDGALRRLDTLAIDDLANMGRNDQYFSTITERRNKKGYWEVTFETVTYVSLLDSVSDQVIQQEAPSAPLKGILTGMTTALADVHDLRQTRELTPLSFDESHAGNLVENGWLMASEARHQRNRVAIYSLRIGHAAIVSVEFTYDNASQTWQLGYRQREPKVTYGPYPNVDVEIVEDVA